MKKLRVLGFIIVLSTVLQSMTALARPFWTEKSVYEEGDKLFVVGVASNVATEEEGRAKALENAKAELRSHLNTSDISKLRIHNQMTFTEPNRSKVKVYRLIYVEKKDLEKIEPEREVRSDAPGPFHQEQTCSYGPIPGKFKSRAERIERSVSCKPLGNGAAFQRIVQELSIHDERSSYFLIEHTCAASPIYNLNGRNVKTSVNCW